MISIIKRNKGSILWASFLKITVALLLTLTTLMTTDLLDSAVAGDTKKLLSQTTIILVAWSITLFIDFITEVYVSKAIKDMNQTLRENILIYITAMSVEDFSKDESTKYVSWLSNDINQIESNAFENLFDILGYCARIIFVVISLCYIHYSVLFFALLFSGIMLVFPKFIGKKMKNKMKDVSIAQEKFITKVKDYLSGFEVLYSFCALNNFKKSILCESEILERTKYDFKNYKCLTNQLIGSGRIIFQVSMIALTGFLVANGVTTIGVIFPVTDFSGTLFSSISGLINRLVLINSTKPLFEKFCLNSLNTYSNQQEIIFNHQIQLKDITFFYNEKKVFDNLNITIKKGKKYAVVGRSGSGKSTLVKLIMGYLSHYEGNIFFDGFDVKEVGIGHIKDNIAYLNQNVYLFSESIKDNIVLHQTYTDTQFQNAVAASCLNDFIDSLDDKENTLLYENGSNVSGGQKQRIALARAIIRNKSIIILDEGTSALDQQTSFEVQSQLLNNENLTVIIITHHLEHQLMNKYDEIIDLDCFEKVAI